MIFKKLYLTLAIALVYTGAIAQSNLDSILYDFYNRPDRILVAAHRAAHINHPENSIPAIKEAIAIGVDIIELDVRETKDGVLVVIHDKTVDRTTNGKGPVADKTFAELQALFLMHNGKETTEKIPTFKEVLQLVKGRVMLDIDYKAEGKRAAKNTAKLLKKMKMEQQSLFFLYDYKDAFLHSKNNKNMQYLARAYNAEDVAAILSMQHRIPAIHGDEKCYSDQLMGEIRGRGKRVWMNALGKYDQLERDHPGQGFRQMLLHKHTNIIQTDLPAELLTFLRNTGRHR